MFELPGGWGGRTPYLILPTPLPLVKIRPRGGRVSTPHLSFAEVGMLFPSHFLLMQFLKYLQCDDLNVTTILIHIEDYGLFSPGLSVKFYQKLEFVIMSKNKSAFAIAKILNCEGNSSDDKILQIQKQMKYLKIK